MACEIYYRCPCDQSISWSGTAHDQRAMRRFYSPSSTEHQIGTVFIAQGDQRWMQPHHGGEGVFKHTRNAKRDTSTYNVACVFDLQITNFYLGYVPIKRVGEAYNSCIACDVAPAGTRRASSGTRPGRALSAQENSSNTSPPDPT